MSFDSAKENFFIPPREFDGVQKVNCRHLLMILAILLPSCAIVSMPKDDVSLRQARQLNQELLILDTHLDTPSRALVKPGWVLHKGEETLVDLPRMQQAGVNAPFMVVYTSPSLKGHDALTHALSLSDVISGWVEDYPRDLSLARSTGDVLAAKKAGKISVVMLSLIHI